MPLPAPTPPKTFINLVTSSIETLNHLKDKGVLTQDDSVFKALEIDWGLQGTANNIIHSTDYPERPGSAVTAYRRKNGEIFEEVFVGFFVDGELSFDENNLVILPVPNRNKVFGVSPAWLSSPVFDFQDPGVYMMIGPARPTPPDLTFGDGNAPWIAWKLSSPPNIITPNPFDWKNTAGEPAFTFVSSGFSDVSNSGVRHTVIADQSAEEFTGLLSFLSQTIVSLISTAIIGFGGLLKFASARLSARLAATFSLVSGDTVTVGGVTYTWLTGVPSTSGSDLSANSEPYPLTLVGGFPNELAIFVDGGSQQVAKFDTNEFVDIDAGTAAEVAAVINVEITGVTAAAVGGKVQITSNTIGTSSSIRISLEGIFDFDGSPQFGTDTVDNSAANQLLLVSGDTRANLDNLLFAINEDVSLDPISGLSRKGDKYSTPTIAHPDVRATPSTIIDPFESIDVVAKSAGFEGNIISVFLSNTTDFDWFLINPDGSTNFDFPISTLVGGGVLFVV